MNPDIVIVRDGPSYRLLHGHLRLSNMLRASSEVAIDVAGEGTVKIVKSSAGYFVRRNGRRLPLRGN